MRLFLDTEFNGFGGELISIALVPEDDSNEFYCVCRLRNTVDVWVSQHVIPMLGDAIPHSIKDARTYFHHFITQFSNPDLVCDWHADAEHFCRMLAGPDYGSSLDFACRITILRTPPGQPVSKVPHNALEDARALKRWFLSTQEEKAA